MDNELRRELANTYEAARICHQADFPRPATEMEDDELVNAVVSLTKHIQSTPPKPKPPTPEELARNATRKILSDLNEF